MTSPNFADKAREAIDKADTLEQLSRVQSFFDYPLYMKQNPDTRVSLTVAFENKRAKLLRMAGATC